MTTSPLTGTQPEQQQPLHSPPESNLHSTPSKIEIRAQSKDNSRTDFKITKDVTPLHHDPMVINFGRRRRPNLTGRTTR